MGNGLNQTEVFDQAAQRLTQVALTTANGDARLQESYQYDAIGSVTQRNQYWDTVGFTESFAYDNANRLTLSAVSGQIPQSFTYDLAGNILSKTNVSNGALYNYNYLGVFQAYGNRLQSIPGIPGTNGLLGAAFTYDGNGNLTNGAGMVTTWTSFDMPLQITRNSYTGAGTGGGTNTGTVIATAIARSSFVYGSEHQRTRQTELNGKVTIYAGAQEVETLNGAVTVKTYWPMGIGVEIDKPNATQTELNWIHTDRLGSPIAISNDAGTLVEKLAYDAWGKRRTLDGAFINANGVNTATPNNIDGQIDNRGFTGHEMLDALDLVHMNGRIYDPLLGRFMSADPLIQDPMNSQSFNRYSYVMNNPTNIMRIGVKSFNIAFASN